MGIPGGANPLLLRRAAAAGEEAVYQIKHGLRFEAGDSGHMKGTIRGGGDSDRRTWTFSVWFKLTGNTPHNSMWLFSAGAGGSRTGIYITNSHEIGIDGGGQVIRKSNPRLRDFSGWYHLTAIADTNNPAQADRFRMYLNNERITSWSSELAISQYWDGMQFGDGGEVIYLGKDAEAGTTNYFD